MRYDLTQNNLGTIAPMENVKQPTTKIKLEESWQEKPSTKCKRNRPTYLSPSSKKIKLEVKMKNK